MDNKKVQIFFYILVIGIFLTIISPNLLSEGMFMDGLIYSTLAKNMSEGLGSFWLPHFSDTFNQKFYGHPPLAFGIQSVFFYILGKSYIVDKIYSIFTFFVSGFLIIRIWRFFENKNSWLPIFLWLITPVVFWASTNNMLENTLTIFALASVYFYLLSTKKLKGIFLILSGLCMFLGLLTKGFVALFTWSFPFFYWLFTQKKTFFSMTFSTLAIFVFSILPVSYLYFFHKHANMFFQNYFDIQIIRSIEKAVTVSSRFYILGKLFYDILPSAIFTIIFLIIQKQKKFVSEIYSKDIKHSLSFIFLGLAGVIPFMITLKQSGFYTLPAYPFFAIGFAFLIKDFVEKLVNKIDFKSKFFKILKYTSFSIFALSIVLSVFFSFSIGRDKNKLADIHTILKEIPENEIICTNYNIFGDWSLQAYFARYKNISLDVKHHDKRNFFLLKTEDFNDSLLVDYYNLNIKSTKYILLKNKNPEE